MKRLLALVLSLLLCVSVLAGCSDSNSSNGSDGGKTVVNVAVNEDPGSLSPWVGNNTGRINILGSIYQHLVETDGFGGEMVGIIMESYEAVDERTFDMKIREGIVDTAGNSIKASDVVFSYQTDIDMGYHAGRLGSIESIEAIDEYTVRWTFKTVPYDGDLCAVWIESYIVSQASYEASDDEMALDPVGSTPYVLTDYTTGTSLTLEKADSYWQAPEDTFELYQANVDVINYKIITDVSQIATGLKTGEVDMTNTIAAIDLASFQEGGEYADGFTVVEERANPAYMLMFNCSDDSYCSNVNLRKAISCAINTDQIVSGVLGGAGFRFNALGNPKYGDYNDSWGKDGYFEYDMDAAKEYLDKFTQETGVNASDLNLVLTLKEGTYTFDEEVTVALQGFLYDLGINATIATQPATTYAEFIADPGNWDLGLICDNGASTAYLIQWYQNVMLPDYYDNDGAGQSHIADQTLFDMINNCRTIEGHTQENMDELNDYINDNCYFYGLCGYYEYFVTTNWITSVCHENRNCINPGGCTYDWSAKK
ncbi:MAG: ABC transporter substrate-binding protein [Oscillospiraceae bacterium]